MTSFDEMRAASLEDTNALIAKRNRETPLSMRLLTPEALEVVRMLMRESWTAGVEYGANRMGRAVEGGY